MYLNAISIELSLPKENHLVQGGYLRRFIAKPELKFFFIRLIYQYGIDEISGVSIEALAKALGVSKNTFVDGMTLLCRIGFYRKSLSKAISTSGKGRPACVYSPTDKLNEKLQRGDLECYWKVLIEDLLVDCGDNQVGLRHPLKLANRLLLITFLMHADEFGKVHSLGYSCLQQLTGMSKQQLASQRKTLAGLGYIIDYQPGRPKFAEKQVLQSKSCYSINTYHSKFPERTRPVELMNQWEINPKRLVQEAAKVEIAKQQFQALSSNKIVDPAVAVAVAVAETNYLVARKEFATIVGDGNAWKCYSYFCKKFIDKQNFDMLNQRIVFYASSMLTKHWDLFSTQTLHCGQLAIATSIKKEISDDVLLEIMTDPESIQKFDVQLSSGELAESFSELLLNSSFGLAKFVYRELTEFVEHKPTGIICNLTICPMTYVSPTMHMPINVLLTEK
ncbi:hypothetical protein B4P00_06785 [Shewanella xiamenensis]|uniref:hypothetical protein n=1 Tax=Shewanella xiamenensis TaxID=332186 RepID=UPI001C4DEE35|nr:hypothetical protein [Shewanella xiamenensis]MBW0295940.1 hypothetical protein [Shewanella xiamenensis]